MIRVATHMVTFEEIPDEISLSLAISGCIFRCRGCHSPELWDDIGEELTDELLDSLIQKNNGISCVLFMGEGKDVRRVMECAKRVREVWKLKTAYYTGFEDIKYDEIWSLFDYIKTGHYDETLGPLNKVTTNQRLYQYSRWFSDVACGRKGWRDITYLFWKNEKK